jgi:Targeting protein for Xklp2 (TPX2) domain
MRATVPHEFRFQVDTRLEARKCQLEKVDERSDNSKLKSKHSIPDFKALHAAHEAELALRKENIHPIVPVPPKFETDARMKERHKFEEQVREKELQRHLELEQKRKERQEREEEEIRELRKKAIPKAHEVPEWYRDAPKKVKSGKGL